VLGVDADAVRSNTTVPVSVDDLLVVYTDGLVERRGRSLDESLARLAEVVQSRREADVAEIADHVLNELETDASDDDVVIVVKRVIDDLDAID
jgi:serine phosphatase RsbU (regulator of sigma subunit)